MNYRKDKTNQSNVAILAHDPYSRNWISHIIFLDWRAQVSDMFTSSEEIKSALGGNFAPSLDILLFDLDGFQGSLSDLLDFIFDVAPEIRIIFLSSAFEKQIFEYLYRGQVAGFLIKSEAEISIGWAIEYVRQGRLVITETVQNSALSMGFEIGEKYLVISGIESDDYLSSTENRYAKMAFVHSMPRGNLADELLISPNSSWTIISNLYNSLGVVDLLRGDDWIDFNLDEQAIISSHFKETEGHGYTTRKGSSKETLAFHVYSKPRILCQ